MLHAMVLGLALSLSPLQETSQVDGLTVHAPSETSPQWRMSINDQSVQDVLNALREAGLQVSGAPTQPDLRVSGDFEGGLSTILARLLRSEDYVLATFDGQLTVRFLSGALGAEPTTLAEQYGPVRVDAQHNVLTDTPDADQVRAGAEILATLMENRLAQAAFQPGQISLATTPGAGGAAGGAGASAASDPERIAAMNQRAREQLAGLVAALRAACPEGSTCD